MKTLSILTLACFLSSGFHEARAQSVIVGVNIANNDGTVSQAFQDDEIKQLAANGVKTIRTGLVSYNIDFIIKAYQHGIGSVVIVLPFLGLKGWSDVVYSKTTPEVFTERVKPMLDKLEAAGVRLTAFELGNEINNSQFNGDLPTVGKGRELGLADLNNPNDPQASQVAAGFRAYVRLMAALKDLRDHSKLNRQTPIISAGLSQVHSTLFEVTLRDTIEFLNQNGIDKLVDGYGIHVYPSGDPKRPVSDRIASLDESMFSACSLAGKSCWVTEWGFRNDGLDGQYCPGNDPVLTKVIQDMRMSFKHFADRGHLAALTYYDWTGRPGAKDTFSVFRCGALSEPGKLALSRLSSSATQGSPPLALILPSTETHARAQDVVVGVNVPFLNNPDGKASRADQEIATLKDLKAAGVQVIRTGITPDQTGIDFVKRIYDSRLKLHWEFGLQYATDAKLRPWQPDKFPNVWAQYPLSQADPERFRTSFQPRLDQLEKLGIQLAAFELTAEINMAPFNGDFTVPGKGRIFGLDDLYRDTEGQQIAKGYLQYLKVLAVLKDIRDHSKLNRQTPIISAGLGSYEFPEGPSPIPGKPGTQTDIVSINATLEFLRANGLDKLVDAYGIHVYPWDNGPGQQAAAEGRKSRLGKYDLTECLPAGGLDGKPCWITEWGFKNKDKSCPVNEANRTALVREMRDTFRPYVQQGRLQELLWYAWIDPTESFGVFRCGALTDAGKLALSPM